MSQSTWLRIYGLGPRPCSHFIQPWTPRHTVHTLNSTTIIIIPLEQRPLQLYKGFKSCKITSRPSPTIIWNVFPVKATNNGTRYILTFKWLKVFTHANYKSTIVSEWLLEERRIPLKKGQVQVTHLDLAYMILLLIKGMDPQRESLFWSLYFFFLLMAV